MRAFRIPWPRRDLIHAQRVNPCCVTDARNDYWIARFELRAIRHIKAFASNRHIVARDFLARAPDFSRARPSPDVDKHSLLRACRNEQRPIFSMSFPPQDNATCVYRQRALDTISSALQQDGTTKTSLIEGQLARLIQRGLNALRIIPGAGLRIESDLYCNLRNCRPTAAITAIGEIRNHV